MKHILIILLIVQLACVNGWLSHVPDRPYINPSQATWTNWQSTFSKACPTHGSIGPSSISRVRSIHSNHYEDRSWAFYCKRDSRVGSCYYSGWRNSFDQPLTYQCPHGVLAGVHSKFSGYHKDRVYDFKCCHTPHYGHYGCHWTTYQNNWDGVMDYKVPPHHSLVGAYSYHDNGKEDRRWKFLVCRLRKYSGK